METVLMFLIGVIFLLILLLSIGGQMLQNRIKIIESDLWIVNDALDQIYKEVFLDCTCNLDRTE